MRPIVRLSAATIFSGSFANWSSGANCWPSVTA
jgi:hypothetical protein